MNIKVIENYVNGQWIEPENSGFFNIENPSTGEIIAKVPLSTPEVGNNAVEAASKAFIKWRNIPVGKRVQGLYKLTLLLRENEDEIARIISEEMGKSLADSHAELKRAIENVEVACGTPVLQQGDKLIGSSNEIDGEVINLPMGVFAIIAPFNFPAMVPFWFIPYAIATGNTIVVKASEQAPLTMQKISEYIDQCGFPAGVFNLVNGDKAVANALVENPTVQGVSLVGATKTCKLVAAKCIATNKRFQAMGSAKNHLVAMPDANVDKMVKNMITSCYGCAGQRCMASSAIVAVGNEMYETVCKKFVEEVKNITVANPLDPKFTDKQMLMGPVISENSKQFILEMIEKGVDEGATLAVDGRDIEVPGCEKGFFVGPTVFTDVKPDMEIHKTEIFGPVVVILKVDSLDEALTIINNHQYGNGASIYTQNGYYARKFKLEALCGMIGINIGIPAPVAYLPFGGMKSSQHADIKAQGKAVIKFFTQDKIITERYWSE